MTTQALRDTLKGHYRSGADDLGRDFFSPCLAASSSYRRASGYFSSGALLTWSDGLLRLGRGESLTIRLIASPHLSAADRDTLGYMEDPVERALFRTVVVERFLDDVVRLTQIDDDRAARARILAWLLASGIMQMRFAFPEHVEEAGLFHEKIGIFDLDDGSQIAFTGSANETSRGHRRNYESVDVFRSWIPAERERVVTKAEQFDETWEDRATGLMVLPPSAAVLDRLRTVQASEPRCSQGSEQISSSGSDPRWRHQDEAIEAFLKAKTGVLEMATGTGKTRTAIRIVSRLMDGGEVDSAIVATDGTDLLEQWALELEGWSHNQRRNWLVLRQFERFRQGVEYVLAPERALLVVSRTQLRCVIDRMSAERRRRTLIVHDEVHGLGMPSLQEALSRRHSAFVWRLGLSATPERTYDPAGNDFVAAEIGGTIYEFTLERAIARGVLAGFDYVPLPYDLTDGDRMRIQALYAKKAARSRDGMPMSNEELWTKIAAIYKTAEMKPDVWELFLRKRPETLKRSIVFVETREYGERVLSLVDEHTNRYRTYYAEDDRGHLVEFARGGIDCLITCHRISQGIDISSLDTVVLFASARARLETVQRIGRCLRLDAARPDKRALVVDFVRPASPGDRTPNADQDRMAWLTSLSKIRRGQCDGDGFGS